MAVYATVKGVVKQSLNQAPSLLHHLTSHMMCMHAHEPPRSSSSSRVG